MDLSHFSYLTFFGALAIFIYGIRLVQSGVQLLMGDRLRVIIARLTDNRLMALGIGALVTLILQSSSATTITLVGFVASGTMTLTQAMGIILGADIGTTIVVILLAIPSIAKYSLLLLVLGIAVDLLRKGKRARYVSMMLMGFGFVFFGMKLMGGITSNLDHSVLLQEIFSYLKDRPLVLLVMSILFTILVQNSAAPIGMAIALSLGGLIDLRLALPIVLGANVGTCSGSMIASLRSNTAGKRVAIAHLTLKTSGVLLVLLFTDPFLQSVQWVSRILVGNIPLGGEIALTHVLFNLYLALVFFSFIKPAAWLIHKVLPDPRNQEEEKFRPRYLDPEALTVPSLAFANAKRELMRMMDLNLEMFRDCWTVFERNDRVLLEMIHDQDDQVDLLDREIKFYLAKISQEILNPEQSETELRLLEMTGTLEEIGDIINKTVLNLAEKKINKGRSFSEEGFQELKDFHGRILQHFQLAGACLASEDITLARKMGRQNEQLIEVERDYRQRHLNRLHQGLKESFETSSIHLDLISNLYRINYLLNKLVRKAYPDL